MFKALTKAVIGTALLPIDVAADALTLGGSLTDREKAYTAERVQDVMKNLKDVTKPEKPG